MMHCPANAISLYQRARAVVSPQGDSVAIRRLARLGGVKRIFGLSYDECGKHHKEPLRSGITKSGGCPKCKLGRGVCRKYNQPGHLRRTSAAVRSSSAGANGNDGNRAAVPLGDDRCSQLVNGVAGIGGSAILTRPSPKEPAGVRQTIGGQVSNEIGAAAARAKREKRSKKAYDPFEESQRPQWGGKPRQTL
eukprot:COSAG02_NODE_681_length_18539_cov_44.668925_2_plen_192_part_00